MQRETHAMKHDHKQTRRAARIAPWLGLFVAAALAGCASTKPPQPEPVVVVQPTEPTRPQPPANVPPVPERNEIVLESGTKLVANTPSGKIIVTAGPGLLRTIQWDGAKRWVVTKAREQRWAGSLGIYYNGAPPHWEPYHGLSRLDYAEGQRHFDNFHEAKIWMQIRRMHFVYTGDGLAVAWERNFDEHTLQVEVWQFLIDGEKPSYLPGAQSYLIRTTQTSVRTASNGEDK